MSFFELRPQEKTACYPSVSLVWAKNCTFIIIISIMIIIIIIIKDIIKLLL